MRRARAPLALAAAPGVAALLLLAGCSGEAEDPGEPLPTAGDVTGDTSLPTGDEVTGEPSVSSSP